MLYSFAALFLLGISLCSVHCASLGSGCVSPVSGCDCYKIKDSPLNTIDCQDKGFTNVPAITPSTELFAELSFSNIYANPETRNRIPQIPRNAFSGLRIKKLDLSKNPISEIDVQGFAELGSDLLELILEGDTKIPPPYSAMSSLSNLTRLHLKDFNVRFLDETNKFSHFSNLETLELVNLNLLYIKEASFRNRLQNLKTLVIRGNKGLKILPVEALKNLPSLEVLRYNNNGLVTLPNGAFQNHRRLRELDLSDNLLQVLETDCFKTVKSSVEKLILHQNKLRESALSPLVTMRWKNLKELDLSDNNLVKLTGLFKNMKALMTLRLKRNSVQEIRKKDLRQLKNLEILELSFNPLHNIQTGSLRNCKKLSEMVIQGSSDGNKMLNLEKNSLAGTENSLKVLSFWQSPLNESNLWAAVRKMNRVERLNLGEASLTDIPNNVFQKLQNLKYLDLGKNTIQTLTRKKVIGLQNSLLSIELHGNQITTLDKCVFDGFTKLQFFNLGDNPLHCDCQLTWLYDWITSNSRNIPFMEVFIKPVCQTPAKFKGQYLTKIPRAALNCTSNTGTKACQDNPSSDARRATPPKSFDKYFQKLLG